MVLASDSGFYLANSLNLTFSISPCTAMSEEVMESNIRLWVKVFVKYSDSSSVNHWNHECCEK